MTFIDVAKLRHNITTKKYLNNIQEDLNEPEEENNRNRININTTKIYVIQLDAITRIST